MAQFLRGFFVLVFSIACEGFSAATYVPKELMMSLLPENPVIIEAGAQFGEDSNWMSLLWPNGALFVFEPSPITYPIVDRLAKNRANISSFQLALSDDKGEMPFYLCGGASSLLIPEDGFNRDYFHVDVNKPVIVQVTTLDHWLDQQGISKVDFLWFDLEGNELNVLKGTQKHLNEVTLIYTEVNLQRFWKGGSLYQELKHWLEDRGFIEIWHELIPGWQGNALFLNQQKRCL